MTKKINVTYLVSLSLLILALFFTSCSNDDSNPATGEEEEEMEIEMDEEEGEEESSNMTSGIVIVGRTSSGSSLVTYSETLPTGTVDLSTGTDFPRFFPTSIVDGAMFMTRPDLGSGFSKIVVNEEGDFVEEGVITTIDPSSFRIGARDSEVGVFQDRANSDELTVFNPTTLEITGLIDMSDGFVPDDLEQRYQRFIFRGDDVYAPVRGNANGEQFTSAIFHQANLSSNTFVGDTQRDGNGVGLISTANAFGQGQVDEAGNLYLTDAGNTNGQGIAGRVNLVPSGSNDIDPTFVFEPALVLNPANIFLPTFLDFRYVGNGIAVARVNAETPQEAIDIVVEAGGLQNVTPEQFQQILAILFTAESAQWCELDLNNLTVTPITGIPPVGITSGGNVFQFENDYFIPIGTETENAYYRYTPGSGSGSLAFSVVGADINGVFNIANDN